MVRDGGEQVVHAAPDSLNESKKRAWGIVVPLSRSLLRFGASHLFVGHWDKSVFGKLPHYTEVRPHVQLAAHQHHFGTRTELLRLPLPLHKKQQNFYNG